ncbi:MAG TPA: DUF4430 domain-containing protein [Candidatus Saccharimonadia bacterium]
MQIKRLWLVAGAAVVIGCASVGSVMASRRQPPPAVAKSPAAVASPKPSSVSFKGQDGQSALALLKQRAVVTMQGTGPAAYVASVNGYRAAETQHEYWALYLNGQLSETSPSAVITHDDDQLEWRIARY